MRFDKKSSSKADKKTPPKAHKKGIVGYNKKTALLEEAITHMNAGKYGRSSAALKELLALDPLNTEARRLFATLHLRLGSLISARTAFESLAREALERQDYWLAESLLREYLSAGPRCVPFLDMLGQLYEAKGDFMAAVAEYGKAIEVLIEDPDPDNPKRAAELFEKIRSVAPDSPVASRLAPLFDPGTGQLLAPPSSTGRDSATETSQAADQLLESNGEPAPSPAASEPPEPVAETATSLESSSSAPEAVTEESVSDLAPHDPAIEPLEICVADQPDNHAGDVHTGSPEPQNVESPPAQTVVEAAITNEEAPFRLVDETSAGVVQSIGTETSHRLPTTSGEFDSHLKQDAASPDMAKPIETPDLSLQEVTNPLAEAPATPLPMPWDQIQDTTLSIPRAIEDETQVPTPQEPESAPITEPADLRDDQPVLPVSSETFLSSMSWEEILAAVGGGASSDAPAPKQSKSVEIKEAVQDSDVADQSHSGTMRDGGLTANSEAAAESQNLSAPMPWEQVQEEAVPILQHEPEPDFGVVPETTVTPFVDDTLSGSSPDTLLFPDGGAAQIPQIMESALPAAPSSPPAPEAFDPAPSTDTTMSFAQTIASDALAIEEPAIEEPAIEDRSIESADHQPLQSSQNDETAPGVDESAFALDSSEPMAIEVVVQDAVPITAERAPVSEPSEDHVEDHDRATMPLQIVPVEMEPTSEAASIADAGVGGDSIEGACESPTPPATAGAQIAQNNLPAHADSRGEEAIALEPPSVNVDEAAAISAHPPAAQTTSVPDDHPTSGDIKILWEDPTLQPTSEQAGSGLLTRWLRRPKAADQADTQVSNEAQTSALDETQTLASDEAQTPNEMPARPSSIGPDMPLEPVPSVPRASAVSAIDVLFDRSERPMPQRSEPPSTKRTGRKPLVGRIYHRIRVHTVLFVGTCFSTTRSITITLFSLASAAVALGILLLGVAGLAWIVMEERPNTAFHTLSAKPQRNLQETNSNGYLMLLGFDGGSNRDPVQAGFERKFEPSDLAMTGTCLMGRGERAGKDQTTAEKSLAAWHKEPDPAARFRTQAASVRAWVDQAGGAMTRYKQWLKMPFEDWGYGEPVSPNCPAILAAHRLYVADGFAQDIDAGVERLEADLAMWRTVSSHARTLSVKMLAADALTDDAAVLSGLLVRPDLEEKVFGRLGKLARPLDQVEQSLRWPMQSELTIAAKIHDMVLKQDSSASRPFYVSLVSLMPLPKQRRLNVYADYYEASSKAASEGRFASFPKRTNFIRSPAESWLDYGANPIENIVGVPPLPEWESYGGRIFEVDARLRLAGLQAWIRRSPQEQDILTRMAKAGQSLYDPFTGFPMLVNRGKGLIYSVGQDGKDHDGQAGLDIAALIPSLPGGVPQEMKRASARKPRS